MCGDSINPRRQSWPYGEWHETILKSAGYTRRTTRILHPNGDRWGASGLVLVARARASSDALVWAADELFTYNTRCMGPAQARKNIHIPNPRRLTEPRCTSNGYLFFKSCVKKNGSNFQKRDLASGPE